METSWKCIYCKSPLFLADWRGFLLQTSFELCVLLCDMQVQAITYLLSPLLGSSVREISKPINLPGPCLEKECSVMEPDDVTSYTGVIKIMKSSVRFSDRWNYSVSLIDTRFSCVKVWALYNQHERPNWYALIIRRTGDRFSRKNQSTGKKLPLSIEM